MTGFTHSHSVLILSVTIFLTCFTTFGHAGVQQRKENVSGSGCSKEIQVSHGFATFVENDDVVLFECLAGFLPYGDMKASCKNQEWSAPPPKCIKKGCPQLKIPINGHFEEIEDFSGALVHFQCDPGYELLGTSEITCDGGIIWSSEPPVCVKLPRKVLEQNDGKIVGTDAEL